MKRCYCCDAEFIPDRNRALCNGCDQSIERFALKQPEDLAMIEWRAQRIVSRVRMARQLRQNGDFRELFSDRT